MDFKLGRINLNAVAQGVGGLVFGNENSASGEDSYVERLLDRISNGVLTDDRRSAMTELQSIVAESHSAQLALGATGLPVLLTVLREEREDVEMVRGALETLVSALTPIDRVHGPKNEVQPSLINSDLFSRDTENISLLLSLLSEDDFYTRYYTLQLLTALLTNSSSRLQEAILAIPRGISRLMDMLMDREVIRNEALLLLTFLTREAEEIQKIVVFEGAFEKIFSVIKEEGGSEGGVVVQDCLELLNNLLRNSASNKILLKETVGFEPLISILKLRKGSAYSFTQQKTVNLLSALDTVALLLTGSPDMEPGKDANRLSNQTALAQNKILDHLLVLGVESKWAAVAVRCSALQCIGKLVVRHPQNLDTLASKVVGEEPHVEPALNSILRVALRSSSLQEFIAADYVFKCFCQKNKEGQAILSSTMTPQPHSVSHAKFDDGANMPFGSVLLHGLTLNGSDQDLETCCRASSILSHILMDNIHCKERALRVELEPPSPSLGSSEPLMNRVMRYLTLASSMKVKGNDQERTSDGDLYIQPIIMRLLVTWLAECPTAVQLFLESSAHLSYLLELVSSTSASTYVRGLAATLLGECVLYNNRSSEDGRGAFAVVDAISQKVGLTSYLSRFDEMQKGIAFVSVTTGQNRKPLSRSNAAGTMDVEDTVDNDLIVQKQEHPILLSIFDMQFVTFVKKLEADIRESVVEVFSRPKNTVAVVPVELEKKGGESDGDYIKRLKSFVEKQCKEMQELLARNAILAEDLAKTGGGNDSASDDKTDGVRARVQNENLRRDLQKAIQHVEMLEAEKSKIESELSEYRLKAEKFKSDLESLSEAYNSLDQVNLQLDSEVKALKKVSGGPLPDLEAIKAEAREEAQKESEGELNDLLVCLGQEQSKVEKLSARLTELGEDVGFLLEGIGDDAGLPEDGSDEDND